MQTGLSRPQSGPRAAGWLRHPMDVHCLVYHAAVVLCYALAFWAWIHPEASGLEHLWQKVVFVAVAAPMLGWISGIDVGVNYHNHAHRPILRGRRANAWLGRLWTVFGGWPAAAWRYLHVSVHHKQLLGPGDWTVPRRREDGRFEPMWRYQLLHWPWRSVAHLAADARAGRLARRGVGADVVWFAILWSIPFWIDPWMGVCLWMLPHWCANAITMGCGMYVQHAGCEVEHAAKHSNTFESETFNLTMFNIGYHERHHDEPWLHWSELPAAARADRPTPARHGAMPTAPLRDLRP